MGELRFKHVIIALFVLLVALLACKTNEAATDACKDESSSDDCEKCCKDNGANGYAYAGDCSCLGG